nr:MAG TPA: hypothetical protein [Caudoviricetes sp.]
MPLKLISRRSFRVRRLFSSHSVFSTDFRQRMLNPTPKTESKPQMSRAPHRFL